MYSVGLYLIQNTDMTIDWGAVGAALVAIGGLIGIWIKMHVSLTEIKVRQENQDRRVDVLEQMVAKQIEVDEGLKNVLTELKVGQAQLSGEVKAVLDRLEKVEK
jgi:uncharacterized coiled-coil protein SlyX